MADNISNKQMYLVTYRIKKDGSNSSIYNDYYDNINDVISRMKYPMLTDFRVFELGNLKEIDHIGIDVNLTYYEKNNGGTNEAISTDGQ